MFKSSNRAFTDKFHDHVHKFCLGSGLLDSGKNIVVAVSGGIDSVALLVALKNILIRFGYSCGLVAIHIDHGTRREQKNESLLVKDLCKALEVEFLSAKIDGLDTQKNFESEARKKRYKKLLELAPEGSLIALGHHIDDSFEWSMLQNFRSSRVEGALGIPVRNGRFIRPFMSVSKAQITRYCLTLDLPFLEDPTNESLKHERNYIRKQLSESFAPRYPKYLKRYVHRQNELARRLGKHISLNKVCDFQIFFGEDSVEIISLSPKYNPSGLENKILEALEYLNPQGRGSTYKQIQKIVEALRNHKKGPLSLAGGLRVYTSFNHLLICRPSYQAAEKKVLDALADKAYKEYGLQEFKSKIQFLYEKYGCRGDYPFYVIVRQKKFNFEGGGVLPMLKDTHKAASGSGMIIVPAIKLIKYWAREKNQTKKLSLRLLLAL